MKTQEFAVDPLKVKQLSFMGEVHAFSWMEKGELCMGLLIPVEESRFSRLCTMLTGNATYTPKKGDRIYKIPPCSLDDKMVKRIAARYGATVTEEIEKATVLLGNDSLGRELERVEAPGRDDLFFKHSYLEPGRSVSQPCFKEVSYQAMGNGARELPEVFVAHVQKYEPIREMLTPTWWATPMGFELLYKWMSCSLPVMSEDHFIGLDERVKMDRDQFEKVTELLLDPSTSSVKIGREMLWRMDFDDPGTTLEFFLWCKDERLKGKVKSNGGKTKREQVFIDKSGIDRFPKMTEGEFLHEMKDVITKEMILRLTELGSELFTLKNTFHSMGIHHCYDIRLIPKKGLENVLKEV
jgi:hypothetical protein